MEAVESVVTYISHAIALVGGAIIFIGVATAFYRLILIEIAGLRKVDVEHDRQTLRHHFGYYILLGLEFLIAADVLLTIVNPGMEELLTLGTIVVIRTLISVALNWELSRAEHVKGDHP